MKTPAIDFQIEGEYIELNKLLKASGLVATGGQAKLLVTEGLVRVDGQIETRLRCKIRTGQTVELEGQRLRVE